MRKWILFGVFVSLLFIFTACGNANSKQEEEQPKEDEDATEATSMEDRAEADGDEHEVHVDLKNQKGKNVGKATLTEGEKGVNIHVEAEGLTEGVHGLHIHEKGICEPPNFESAGGHFNPTDAKHGFDNPEGPHAGDLPNLEVGSDGTVNAEFLTDLVTLKEGEKNSLFREGGTSLMIHSGPDDYVSQPAGDSGDRVVCGVIKK